MDQASASDRRAAAVTAELTYAVDTGEKPVNETFGPGNIRRRASGAKERRRVRILNGRPLADEFALDVTGFAFVRHPTAVEDFFDADTLESVYYAEIERLLAHRFAIIQVWRAINRPIRVHPLAIADARSLASDDLIAAERRYPHRVGETYQVRYNPAHRWFHFPEMRRDEALVFKVYDSAKDGRARFTAHTSFIEPESPADAPPRQSIEVRTFAFFAPPGR